MIKGHSSLSRIAFFALLLVFVGINSSCEKYSSPRKVERLIVGQWKLSSAFIDNSESSAVYANYSFVFSKDGKIDVLGDETISGIWSTGIEKNPTTLNLTLTPFAPFYDLNADWTVTTCTKDRMTLELYGAAATDNLILTKVN